MTDRSPALTARSLVALGVSLALAFAISAAGGSVTAPAIDGWYAGIEKPVFTPPPIVFPIVWTTLYVLMALAAWLVWRNRRAPGRERALALYGVQLALNLAWPFAFFAAENPPLGLGVIAALVVALGACVHAFGRVDRLSGALMLPYLAWAAFATALNGAIVWLN